MNKQNHIEILFEKFTNNTINEIEFNELIAFVKNTESKETVKEMMDSYWSKIELSNKNIEKKTTPKSETQYKQILQSIESRDQSNRKHILIKRFNYFYKTAAVIAIFFGLFHYMNNSNSPEELINIPLSNRISTEAITLKMSNGTVKIITENKQEKIIDPQGNIIGLQKGNKLNYNKNKTALNKLVYNELTVPYGKLFDLVLSDGTKIKLNSGSTIKYPIQFIEGKNRKVFLTGEAYFEVTKNETHPFIVNTNEINVKVLGTQFNVSYYPEDSSISTVLVEGSVELIKEEDTTKPAVRLVPGQKATWHKTKKELSVEKVNIDLYTAWKDGILLLRKTSFKSIRKKLERRFNVSIENHSKSLDKQVYTASFRKETIEDVLNAFKEDTPFEYKIENNKITITNPNIN